MTQRRAADDEPQGPSPAINPYAPSSLPSESMPERSDEPEQIRRKLINREASIRSIGSLYVLGAVLMMVAGAGVMAHVILTNSARTPRELASALGACAFYLCWGLLQGIVGIALHRLRPWSRIVAIVFSAVGLFAFPIGTLLSAYFLYLLLGNKALFVFSDQYRRIIDQTPHVKYKTPVGLWLLLILLAALLIVAVVASLG
jgi:hypothetical protein